MDMTIHHVGVFRNVERINYLQVTPCLSLTFSGFQYYCTHGVELHHPGPFISIHPGAQRVGLACDHRRENWVVLFSSPHLHQAPQADCVELYCHGEWVAVPKITPLPVELVLGWRIEMERLREAFFSSLPHNILRIEAGVMNILRFVLDQQTDRAAHISPVLHLKQLIDADERCEHTLEEFSLTCGYSSDHLRILFAQEFKVTPLEYRQRRRMAKAMELIANSRLSARAIAEQLGFRHASHFSMAFREAFQLTPRDAIQRFR